jgi:protein phosphatase 2C family protein 2/3
MHSTRHKFHIKTITEQKENLSPLNLKKLFQNINKSPGSITETDSHPPNPFPGLAINKPHPLKFTGVNTHSNNNNVNQIHNKNQNNQKNKVIEIENTTSTLISEPLPKLQFSKKFKTKTINAITTHKFSALNQNHPLMNRTKNLSTVNLKSENGLGKLMLPRDIKTMNEDGIELNKIVNNINHRLKGRKFIKGNNFIYYPKQNLQEYHKFNRINSTSNVLGKDNNKHLMNMFNIGVPLSEIRKKKRTSNSTKEECCDSLPSSSSRILNNNNKLSTNRRLSNDNTNTNNQNNNNNHTNRIHTNHSNNNILGLGEINNINQIKSVKRLKKSFSLNKNVIKKSKTLDEWDKEEEISPLLTNQNINSFSLHIFPKSKLYLVPRSSKIPIKAFSLNTTNGLIRDYNEDTLTATPILQNSAYFFGIFDGHGGKGCASYLQMSLPGYITSLNTKSLTNAILNCEKTFLKQQQHVQDENEVDKSGSCANIVIVTKQKEILFLNIGDSRAMYLDNNFNVVYYTEDHKPNSPSERERIVANGGSVYQNNPTGNILLLSEIPFRVLPGRLSVSRTIGDIEAKDPIYGGNDKVIIAEPDIYKMEKWTGGYLLIGCDGIFDVLNNKEVSHCMKLAKEKCKEKYFCDVAVDLIIKAAMVKNSLDNLSCIILELEDKYT